VPQLRNAKTMTKSNHLENGDQLEELQILEKTKEGRIDMYKEAEISTASMLIRKEKCRKPYLSH